MAVKEALQSVFERVVGFVRREPHKGPSHRVLRTFILQTLMEARKVSRADWAAKGVSSDGSDAYVPTLALAKLMTGTLGKTLGEGSILPAEQRAEPFEVVDVLMPTIRELETEGLIETHYVYDFGNCPDSLSLTAKGVQECGR